MENKNTGIKVAIVILCILVVGLTGYIVYDKVLNQDNNEISDIEKDNNIIQENNENSNTSVEDTNINNSCNSYVSESFGIGMDNINYDELAKIGKLDYNFVKGLYGNDYSINILSNGKILINFNNYISNISNAKDILKFNGLGPIEDSIIYILTDDGNIYKYALANIGKNNFEATIIDDYNNIEKMMIYKTRKANAGGCDYLILIDNDNKYYTLDSYCV